MRHSNCPRRWPPPPPTFRLRGEGSGRRIDVPANAAAGTRVRIWDCTGGANQQWNVNTNGTVSNVQCGVCLDVCGAATANGTAVNVWSCHTGANQRWARA